MASGFLMTGHEIGAALGVAVLSAVATAAGNLATIEGAAAGFSLAYAAGLVLSLTALRRTTGARAGRRVLLR